MPITTAKCTRSTYSGRMTSQVYIRAHLAAPNRYAGRCFVCGATIAPGQGAVQKSETAGWVVFC